MAVDTTRHFERTIRDLETKLARQQSAVMTTLEMIDAIKALRDKERAESEQSKQEAINNATKQQTTQRTKV